MKTHLLFTWTNISFCNFCYVIFRSEGGDENRRDKWWTVEVSIGQNNQRTHRQVSKKYVNISLHLYISIRRVNISVRRVTEYVLYLILYMRKSRKNKNGGLSSLFER